MTKEEMAKAYADGFIEEYREIAYDAFLCGYGAKCSLEIPNDLEEAARQYFEEPNNSWEVREVFIAGAKWQKEQMMKEAVEGEVCGRVYDHINVRFADGVCKFLEPKNISHIPADVSKYKIGDKVRIIIVKED